MEGAPWITLAVLAATLIGLQRQWASMEITMFGALTLLMLLGVVDASEALSGFGSTAVFAVAGLLIIAAGIRRTGLLSRVADGLLGVARGEGPTLRLLLPVAAMSAFLNNTPIVAMFAPAVLDWCRRNNRAPSSILMPLSYATILGGMCTLIGTSTTLIVDELMRRHGMPGLGMFEISAVGIPVAICGIACIWLLASRVLPDRRDPVGDLAADSREFLVEMLVDPTSPLIGRSITEAGLRSLPGLFLMAIERGGRFLTPITPQRVLQGDDRLVFAGVASTVVDLRRFPGLAPAPDTHYDPDAAERRSHTFAAVVAMNSPLVGSTIKNFGFRSHYDAAVIAVHRAGSRLAMKLGDLEVRAGDTLMIEAVESFVERWGDSAHFSLVAMVQAELSPKRSRTPWAIGVLAAMILVVGVGWVPMVVAALVAAGGLIAAGLVNGRDVWKALNLPVLITMASAIGLGRALEISGAATILATPLQSIFETVGPVGLLACCFALTAVVASLVSNVAAAAMLFPVVHMAALAAGLDPRPFAIVVALAATASFLTPTGYHTNLMVYGPGGYRFTDFARLGAPLLLVVGLVTITTVPMYWPLLAP